MPTVITTSDGSCCCPAGPPDHCTCPTYAPPDVLCADISGCTRCTEINRRYRLVKGATLPAIYGANITFTPGFPTVPKTSLDWWTGTCQVACGKWHHLTLFRYKSDGCTWSVDDCFSVDEAGTSVYANWGAFCNVVTPVVKVQCDPTIHFTQHVTSNRLYIGNGFVCAGCATFDGYTAAGSVTDSFDVSVFEDASCAGCNPGFLPPGMGRVEPAVPDVPPEFILPNPYVPPDAVIGPVGGPARREFYGADRYTCIHNLGPSGERAVCEACGGVKRDAVPRTEPSFVCELPHIRRCHPTLKLTEATLCAQCNCRVPKPGFPDGYRAEKQAAAARAAKAAAPVRVIDRVIDDDPPAAAKPAFVTVIVGQTSRREKPEAATPRPSGTSAPRPAGLILPTPAGAPSRVAVFSHRNLAPGQPGRRFNASLLDDPAAAGSFLFCYRDGWSGSEIHLCRLDAALAVREGPWKLDLAHPIWACYGREDPRLFFHDGRVHVAYIGVQGRDRITHTNVLYARLTEDCSRVEEVFYVHYRGRNAWEKNWQFFSHGGRLYAVYCFAPHRVLAIDGDVATVAHESDTMVRWDPGTEIRGGASPALVGGEYWSFFHSRIEADASGTGRRRYVMGLYAFRAEPPFDVLRIAPEPLMLADPATNRNTGDDNYADVVFPNGAVLVRGSWLVAMGVHDRYAEIHRFDHAELESRLAPCRPPAWWAYPAEGVESSMIHVPDRPRVSRRKVADDIFLSVAIGNEYGLPARMDGWAVLDVGAHAGSFAFAASARGADAVHAYEPNADHFAALAQNARRIPGVTAYRAAVGCPEREGDDVVSLSEAVFRLAAARPSGRVDLIKIDCEGCEWESFADPDVPWRLVDRVVGEYHLFPGRGLSLEALFDPLRASGFAVEHGPPASGDAFWGLFSASRVK